MPDPNTDADAKLQKLGHRVREGLNQQYPPPERNLETVRQAIREEWEKEQKLKSEKLAEPEPEMTKDKEREPDEPSEGR